MRRTKSQLIEEVSKLRQRVATLGSEIEGRRGVGAATGSGAAGETDGKFQKLVEESLQGILVFTLPDWRPLFVNEAAASIYGYGSTGEMMHLDTLEAIVHPKDRAHLKRQEEKYKSAKRPYFNEFRGVRKDGSIIDVHELTAPIEWGGEMALLATSLDITEQKIAERILGKSEESLQLITDNLPAFVAYIDGDGYEVVPENRTVV